MSKILVKQRAALDEMLRVAPTTLANLFLTYNPQTGTLDTRANVGENLGDQSPATRSTFLCGILDASRPEVRQVLVRPPPEGAPQRPRRQPRRASGRRGSAPARQVETVDRTLGGILEVRK